MQARLQEINDRIKSFDSCSTSSYNHIYDIKYLLDALEQEQKNSDNQKIVIDTLLEAIEGWKTELQQSQDRERVLMDALIEIEKGSCTRWISNIVNEALKEDKP